MSIADIPNTMALPSSAQMKLRPSAVPATRKRLSVQPYQRPTGEITSASLLQFYVPARRNTMYDPTTMYLKGRIATVTTAGADATTVLNKNAFSLINRLQVYGQDSTLLEDIQNYNILTHSLMDIQMSREDKYGLSTMYASNDGTTLNNIDNGFTNPEGAYTGGRAFCIPVVSAFGLLADTLIPIGWLNSDLRFDFYLEVPTVAFHDSAGAVTSYTLDQLELVVDTIEFDPSSMQMVNEYAPVNAPLFCHATTYKGYVASFASATTGFTSTLVPHRSLSCKTLLVSTLCATSYNVTSFNSFARVLPYGTADMGLQLSIGGLKYPQKSIVNYAEAFAELQKSQHAFNQLILNGSINTTEYVKYQADVTTLASSLTAKPVLGFDLEIYDKKGSTIINGQNWTGLNVFIEGNIARNYAGNALTAGLTSYYHVNYDVIYVIQDGVISVRF